MQILGTSPTCLLESANRPSLIESSPPCTISGYELEVSSFLLSTIPTGTELTLSIQNMLGNPIITETTSKFVLSTYSSGGHAIDQDTSLDYVSTSETIGSISIVSDSSVVG